MKKIGLLGGTFDPVHNGHLIISEYLREELSLDEIWFIPARIHALKKNQNISPAQIRLEMLQLAIADNPCFKINDIELQKDSVSYTVDTLRALEEKYRNLEPDFYFLIGMDNVNDLPRWKNPEEILSRCQMVAFGRPGFKPDESAERYLSSIQFIHVPLLEISSTLIRNRVKNGFSIRYLVPDPVLRYIQENKLYRNA